MYLNYMLICAVEIPGTLTGLFLMQKIGRKASLASGFFFSAICNILFIIVPVGKDDIKCFIKFIIMIAILGIFLASFDSVYN